MASNNAGAPNHYRLTRHGTTQTRSGKEVCWTGPNNQLTPWPTRVNGQWHVAERVAKGLPAYNAALEGIGARAT